MSTREIPVWRKALAVMLSVSLTTALAPSPSSLAIATEGEEQSTADPATGESQMGEAETQSWDEGTAEGQGDAGGDQGGDTGDGSGTDPSSDESQGAPDAGDDQSEGAGQDEGDGQQEAGTDQGSEGDQGQGTDQDGESGQTDGDTSSSDGGQEGASDHHGDDSTQDGGAPADADAPRLEPGVSYGGEAAVDGAFQSRTVRVTLTDATRVDVGPASVRVVRSDGPELDVTGSVSWEHSGDQRSATGSFVVSEPGTYVSVKVAGATDGVNAMGEQSAALDGFRVARPSSEGETEKPKGPEHEGNNDGANTHDDGAREDPAQSGGQEGGDQSGSAQDGGAPADADAPHLEPGVSYGGEAAVDGAFQSRTVRVTLTDATRVDVGPASVRVVRSDGPELDVTGSVSWEHSGDQRSATGSFVVSEPGTYVSVKVAGATDGINAMGEQSAALDGFRVADYTGPVVRSVALRKGTTVVKDNLVGASQPSPEAPLYLNVDGIEVVVEEDALRLSAADSYLLVVDGEGRATRYPFVRDGGANKAIASPLPEGPIAVRMVAKDVRDQSAEFKFGGTDEGSAYVPTGNLCVDTGAPAVSLITSARGESQTDLTARTDAVVNPESIVVEVVDSALDVNPDRSFAKLGATSVPFQAAPDAKYLYRATIPVDADSFGEGKYVLQVVAFDRSNDESHHAEQSIALTIDRTMPKVASVRLAGANVHGGAVYPRGAIEAVLDDEHLDSKASFVSYQNDGSAEPTVVRAWDESGKLTTDKLPEGTYTITVHAADVAGNVATDETFENIVIDDTAPVIGKVGALIFGGLTPTTQTPEGVDVYTEKSLLVDVPVWDAHPTLMPGRDFEVNVTKDGAPFDTGSIVWVRDGEGSYAVRGGIVFTESGTYKVSVTARDALGNVSTLDTRFLLDSARPAVSATTSAVRTGSDEAYDYYNKVVSYDVKVSDAFLDLSKTTVAGVSLDAIRAGAGDAASYKYERDSLLFSNIEFDENDTTCSLRVSFLEGIHAVGGTSIVEAWDYGRAASERLGRPFVVDTHAPTVALLLDADTFTRVREFDALGLDSDFALTGAPTQDEQRVGEVRVLVTDAHALDLEGITVSAADTVAPAQKAFVPGTDQRQAVVTLSLGKGAKLFGDVRVRALDRAANLRIASWNDVSAEESDDALSSGSLVTQGQLAVQNAEDPILDFKSSAKPDGCYSSEQTVWLLVTDSNFGTYDKTTNLLTVKKDGAEYASYAVEDTQEWGVDTYAVAVNIPADAENHTDDGVYELTAEIGGVKKSFGSITIDTTVPEIDVALKEVTNPASQSTHAGVTYWDTGVTATVTVKERNFDPADFEVQMTARNGKEVAEHAYTAAIKDGGWSKTGDTYTYVLDCSADATYSISVRGKDKAGSQAETNTVPAFVVDTEAPSVSTNYMRVVEKRNPGKLGETYHFNQKIQVRTSIKDRNIDLNPIKVTIKDPEVRELGYDDISWEVIGPDAKGYYTYSFVHTYEQKGECTTSEFKIADASGNDASLGATTFVIDYAAPEVTSATVILGSDADAKAGPKVVDVQEGEDERSYRFYNQSTTVRVEVKDDRALKSTEISDPRGEEKGYKADVTYAEDGTGATVSVKFKDGLAFDRSVTLTATDVAGNERVWSIAPNGTVKAVEGSTVINTAVEDAEGSSHPHALIMDLTKPVVWLSDTLDRSGASTYYCGIGQDYSFSAHLQEQFFGYLRVFDAGRQIVQVNSLAPTYDARANGNWTTSYLTAGDAWNGEDPNYTLTHTLSKDGDYTVQVDTSFTDLAGNQVEGTPSSLGTVVIDHTAPVISVSLSNASREDVDGVHYYRAVQVATITVREHNFDEGRVSITTGITGKASEDNLSDVTWTDNHDDAYTATVRFDADGIYRLRVQATDKAGNEATPYEYGSDTNRFVIDMTNPIYTVEYKDGENRTSPRVTLGDVDYWSSTVTATITVDEVNFDAERFSVGTTFSEHASDAHEPVVSEWTSDGNTHTCTVQMTADGKYRLTVAGTDMSGRAAFWRDSDGEVTQTKKYGQTLVVDANAPEISTDYAVQCAGKPVLNGAPYFDDDVRITVTVRDRYLDTSTLKVTLVDPATKTILYKDAGWKRSGPDQDGLYTYTASFTYTEGKCKSPAIQVRDLSLNETTREAFDFVVDKSWPEINQVNVTNNPSNVGRDNGQGDPYQFYNQPTSMNISFRDNLAINRVEMIDPENQYSIASDASGVTRGDVSGSVRIDLVDGTQSSNDTEYERDIIFTVWDVAGNWNRWTIDHNGTVKSRETGDAGESHSNAAVTTPDGEGSHPVMLVPDYTAPVVGLSGVTAGTYYNTTQTVHASVNEFNFDHLTHFEGGRSIVYVTKYAGNASRAREDWTIPASNFGGSRPNYSYDLPFEGDGHYELYAEFRDYAGNLSNRATIGEFTIDKTAPTIELTWDNNDVRNGKYYKAGRVATITVVEHNFDPSLFTITSNGVIGGWATSGDTHTATVSFRTDGSYKLSVSGRDRASNEAKPVTAADFVVDLTAPKVSFAGRVQRYGVDKGKTDDKGDPILENKYDDDLDKDGATTDEKVTEEELQDRHAYNGVVMPSIKFYDQPGNGATNYDAKGVSFTLTGGKQGNVSDNYSYEVQAGTGGQTYQFADFGLVQEAIEEAYRNVYDPDADDVYTIDAKMTDLAGNTAEGKVTFSVNRYGSNYIVEAYDVDGSRQELLEGEQDEGGIDYDLLGSSPLIKVREINVSGSESSDDHTVLKEYANATTTVRQAEADDKKNDGYELETVTDSTEVEKYGWSEYVYTIRDGNFGINSPSDTGDGGQGVYRVNVTSVDRASNDTSTADYLSTGDYDQTEGVAGGKRADPQKAITNIASALRNGTASFTLDEIAPVIDELSAPAFLAVGTSCKVSAHVTDAITRGDIVRVYVDGRELTESEFTSHGASDGTGSYEFEVPTSYIPFSWHEVYVVASDGVKGRSEVVSPTKRFMVTILVPEIAAIVLAMGAVWGGTVLYRKRKMESGNVTSSSK